MRQQFTIYGIAQPAGSKRAFAIRRGGKVMTRPGGSPVIAVSDANPKSRGWKNDVAAVALAEWQGPPLTGPVRLTLRFFRDRPAGHRNKKGELNKEGRESPFPIARPDVLKLARGVEDALTGIAWRDDAQIVVEILEKHYTEIGGVARVEVSIEGV